MSSQGSRLTQIQMRYQQKVMQENAQKKSDMHGLDDAQKLLTSSLGAGKVRAMFVERRNRITAGIDKSYLLEPIAVDAKTKVTTTTITTKQQQQQRQVIGAKSTRDQKMNYSKVIVPPLQNRYINNHHDINGNNHATTNEDTTLERTPRSNDTALVNLKSSTTKITAKSMGSANGGGSVAKKSSPTSTSAPLKNVTNQKPSPSRSLKSGTSTASTNSMRSTVTTNGSPRVGGGTPQARSQPVSAASAKSFANSPHNSFDEVDDDAPVPEGLVRCDICKRNFAEDRIEKHTVICLKTKTKKRKVYDASKKRVQGTEAESYNRKPISARAVKQAPQQHQPPSKANNWRAKHDDFIRTIRAAKEMQAYVAKGGKLSDLPPPPPSVNPDYVQCPHCSRRFNEAAASRHIPICQSINKPKPKAGGLASKANSTVKRR